MAKAKHDAKIAASIDHLRGYIEYLINPASQKGKRS
jgi:hypothetical protein